MSCTLNCVRSGDDNFRKKIGERFNENQRERLKKESPIKFSTRSFWTIFEFFENSKKVRAQARIIPKRYSS